jgi:hypothetical protein
MPRKQALTLFSADHYQPQRKESPDREGNEFETKDEEAE